MTIKVMTKQEEIRTHKCEGLNRHNKALAEEIGNESEVQEIYSGCGWRLRGRNEQWLIDYCPYCGVKLEEKGDGNNG